MAHNLRQMLHLRPHNRFEDLDRVYLVGGGTHPGSGLPVIFESARITARLLLEDLKVEPQWDTAPVLAEAAMYEAAYKMAAGCTIKSMPLHRSLSSVPVRVEPSLGQARAAQQIWAPQGLRARLAILRRARHSIAASAVEIAQSVPCEQPGALHRSVADTLVSEVLPLVEACRFLEREARWILAPQRLSTHARPFWLRRVTAETTREPLGVVLIIAPANYPLFLPGVQVLQALAAGNAVLWKPAAGGTATAEALRGVLVQCGLDPALLQLLDESPHAAVDAIAMRRRQSLPHRLRRHRQGGSKPASPAAYARSHGTLRLRCCLPAAWGQDRS